MLHTPSTTLPAQQPTLQPSGKGSFDSPPSHLARSFCESPMILLLEMLHPVQPAPSRAKDPTQASLASDQHPQPTKKQETAVLPPQQGPAGSLGLCATLDRARERPLRAQQQPRGSSPKISGEIRAYELHEPHEPSNYSNGLWICCLHASLATLYSRLCEA